jgi:hypothetical protein
MEAATLLAKPSREALSEMFLNPGMLRAPGVILFILAGMILSSIFRYDHPQEIFIFIFAAYILLQAGLMLAHPSVAVNWLKRLYGQNLQRAWLMAVLDLALALAFLYLAILIF